MADHWLRISDLEYCSSQSTGASSSSIMTPLELSFQPCSFPFDDAVKPAVASLYNTPGSANADLFGIYRLLSNSISSAAGLIYALFLLFSGISAGIVCTMAGQMVSEGMLKWSIRPWLRRVTTRSISVVPSIVIAGAVGEDGLNKALDDSQVVLCVILPIVTAPLIYFTCRSRYMTVRTDRMSEREDTFAAGGVKMRNNILVCAIGLIIWLILVVMNVALIVLIGLGKA